MQLSQAQGDRASLRTHLQRLRASTGRLDPRLARACEPMPPAIAPLWDVFAALCGTRGQAFDGMAPLSCTEVQAWCQLHQVRLTPWEVETLFTMDRAARAAPTEAVQ
jgi:hypothetical protein